MWLHSIVSIRLYSNRESNWKLLLKQYRIQIFVTILIDNVLHWEVQGSSGNTAGQLGGSKARGQSNNLLELLYSISNWGGAPLISWVFWRSCALLGSGPVAHMPILTVEDFPPDCRLLVVQLSMVSKWAPILILTFFNHVVVMCHITEFYRKMSVGRNLPAKNVNVLYAIHV